VLLLVTRLGPVPLLWVLALTALLFLVASGRLVVSTSRLSGQLQSH
jgi:hypothetical protein